MTTASIALTRIPCPPPVPLAGRVVQSVKLLNNPLRYMRHAYDSSLIACGPEYNRLLLSNAALFYTIFLNNHTQAQQAAPPWNWPA